LNFQLGLIAVVVMLAGISAASGLGKGLRMLSEMNLLLAIALMGFVLFAGPTLYLLGSFSENLGNYFSSMVEMTFRNYTYEPTNSEGWFGGWTILYWAWWISWSPFVGMFIARISRGRTIREFIVGVLIIPSLFNFMWMTVFGNTAIWIDTHAAAGALGATAGNVDALLFQFFNYLPFTSISSGLAVLLIAVFFVTSADSGAFVIDNIATRGNLKSPVWQRLLWAGVIGLVACCLLSAGGLKALQAMTLIAALPFAFVMLLLCFGLLRGLRADAFHSQQKLSHASNFWTGKQWKQRLHQILHQSGQQEAQNFIDKIVHPAMQLVQQEFQKNNVLAHVARESDDAIQLRIAQDNLREFVYGVRCIVQEVPSFVMKNNTLPTLSSGQHYVPTTYFADGRKGYDIHYFTEEELLADILKQYERHLSLSMNAQAQLLQQAPSHLE
jgi:choline/glycine/proline betaine transport protein